MTVSVISKAIRSLVLSLTLAALCFSAAYGQMIPAGQEPYWQQQADYRIEVRLDDRARTLSGSSEIRYINNSPDTLYNFYMHLYPNAYSSKSSQLIRDYMPGTLYFLVGLSESKRGWMEIEELRADGAPLEYEIVETILSAEFPSPLLPGEETVLDIKFAEKIRKTLGRAGYTGDHYDMAQWYPKIAVYDKTGWHADQFRKGEFYADFGNYDVHISLPEKYVVAATGELVSGDPGWMYNFPDGEAPEDEESGEPVYKKLHFRAERVHDFAWCADPEYVVQDTTVENTRVMSFFREGSTAWRDSVLARGVRTLKWLEKFVGPYEYPQVTIAEAFIHGGMEYPMLAMNSSPDEDLIVHEVGHNYFYGMLANNEREEAWMDEGFTQYQMFRRRQEQISRMGRGEGMGGHGGHSFTGSSMWKGIAKPVINAHRTDYAERVATPHHEFQNNARLMLYIKAPLFLRALRYVVGDQTFDRIIRVYFERWKFKHVDEAAFLEVCEEVSGMQLDEIFKQWLHTNKDCDYSLEKLETDEVEGGGYRTALEIKRKGEMMMPLELALEFEDGSSSTERIDGMLRTIRDTMLSDSKPVRASINPENEILDIYHLDNFSPRKYDWALDRPFERHYPADAYQFRLLPVGYYNDIDGGLFGLRLKGGYDNRYHKFTLQQMYGAESETYNVYSDYSHPLGYFGRDAFLNLQGYYREGRRGASISIDKKLRSSYSDPLPRDLSFRLVYQELTDSAYVIPGTYEDGFNLKWGMTFAVYPKVDVYASSFTFNFDRSLWGSDFRFEDYTFDLKLWPARRFPLPVKPRFRFFLVHTAMDPPRQERNLLSGRGFLDRENYFFLRSPGAFWEDSYSNIRVAGGASLRGYFDNLSLFKTVFASNMELGLPFPVPMSRKVRRMANPDLFLFYDWGKVHDSLSGPHADALGGIISDFGIGFRLFGISAEFPFYLSHPSINGDEEKYEFRWTVGINRVF